ncbi:MAG: type 4a pilus biogenesis protein PilO [Mycobacteriales bacterium]
MGKMKQYWLLTGVLIVAMLGAGYFFGAKPQAAKAKSVKAETTVQAAANKTLQDEIKILEAQAKGLAGQETRLREIAAIMPSNPALPKLVRTLTRETKAAGIDLTSIAPGAPTAVIDAAAPAPAAGGSLSAIPLNLVLTGDFTQLQLFITNLEKLERKLDRGLVVDTFSVSPQAAATSPKGKKNLLAVSISARVFMKSPPAPVAAPVKPVAADSAAPVTTEK